MVGKFGDMTAFLDEIWQAGWKEAYGATHDAHFPCMTNSYKFDVPAPGLSPVHTYQTMINCRNKNKICGIYGACAYSYNDKTASFCSGDDLKEANSKYVPLLRYRRH